MRGLRGSLNGTGRSSPEGFKCQHRYWVGNYSSSPHSYPKRGRVTLVGPVKHLFLPLGPARPRRNPRSGGLTPLPGCSSALGSAPLPTCHTSPRHTPPTPLDPSPCLSRPLRVPGQARRCQAVSWARRRGLSWPRGRTKPGERQRRREARPLPRAGGARAPAPRPPLQPPKRHSRSGLR